MGLQDRHEKGLIMPLTIEKVRGWTYYRKYDHFVIGQAQTLKNRKQNMWAFILAVHDGATLVKVWEVTGRRDRNHTGKLRRAELEATTLARKLDKLYPLHMLAKEWPRDAPKA